VMMVMRVMRVMRVMQGASLHHDITSSPLSDECPHFVRF
jgi:hypothetical protein